MAGCCRDISPPRRPSPAGGPAHSPSPKNSVTAPGAATDPPDRARHDTDGMGGEQFVHTYEIAVPS
eukprot:3886462-Prymnesium_polylepis.2